MIILGQAGIPDFLPLYEAQIKDPNQILWVKLWAIEGMVNVIEEGGRLTAQDQILAAKTVAEFLEQRNGSALAATASGHGSLDRHASGLRAE